MRLHTAIDMFCTGRKLQGRTTIAGLDISIENRKGSIRQGVDKDGKPWRTKMGFSYGYIRKTQGVDGDQVDVYVGPNTESDKVFVIHQNDPVTGKYDEDKCMLGFDTAKQAKKAYMVQYNRPGFYGSMTVMTMDEFKEKVLATNDKPQILATEMIFLPIAMEPESSYHPPSLTDTKPVPVDNPGETDDQFMDVTNRNSQSTKEFRDKLTERHGRPEFVWQGTQRIPNAPQRWQ